MTSCELVRSMGIHPLKIFLKISFEFGVRTFYFAPAHVERCGAALAGTGRPGGGEVGHRITAVINFVLGVLRG